ncbi:Xaa-Pro dipeptidyl-peptidase [Motilibacter deserti]|uniref:Xaa-Pro dipeptidyl-peptidase n=1 Tax=Motilibacter deserti TaxID=2714956 RepID=A0ABX0GY50_9ACTN|nr:Xaa-Pro dipeptidyl-peptidase [Motilibacter deserti]NHC14163.1 Xaa-Pro dipeptidyl-peptidase [Motilibacter deserti]
MPAPLSPDTPSPIPRRGPRSSPRGRRAATLTAFALAVVSPVAAAPLASQASAAPAPAPAVPTFVDGLSQAVFSTNRADWVTQELWVESEVDSDFDGKKDRIHVDVTRPKETVTDGLKVPVIYEVSPYYSGGSAVTNWGVDHEIGFPPATKGDWNRNWVAPNRSPNISDTFENVWLPRGYAVVHAESVGTGYSDGCPTSGGRNETLGAKAAVDWLNGNAVGYTSRTGTDTVTADWTTGRTAMIGTSYNGTLPQAVATTGVKGLEAIVPISAISSWYDYYRANGTVRAPGGYQGEDLDVLADYVYSRADRAICRPVIDALVAQQDRATGDYSAFWDERNYMNDISKVKAATIVAHGLNDWNVQTKHAAQFYEGLKANGVPHQIYLHQGGHGGAPPDVMLNRWFTRYLYDQQNGVESLPKAWIVPQGGTAANPQPHPDWPAPNASPVTLSLGKSADGTAGSLGLLPTAAGTTETIVDDATKTLATLANTSTLPTSANRTVYKTAPLTADVRMSGTTTAALKVSFSKPAANLSFALLDYNPNGTVKRIVTRGWVDPQNAGDLYGKGAPLVPGRQYSVTWDAQPLDWVFSKGQQLGIAVYSSDREFTIRPAPGTELTLDTSASSITIPIVGGATAFATSTGVTAPTATVALDPAAPTGANGWYVGNVGVDWAVSDGGAPTSTTGCSDTTITQDGTFTLACTVTNLLGSGTESVTVRRDATAPTVTPTGVLNGGSYGDSTTRTLSWTVSDATSGADTSTATLDGAPVANGAAVDLSTLALGSHSLVVTAKDRAGNTTVATVAFTVTTSTTDMQALADRYLAAGVISQGAATNLRNRLDGAVEALAEGNTVKAARYLQQYVEHAERRVDDAAARALLVRDARALLDQIPRTA